MSNNRGITLIEVVASMAILAMVLVPTMSIFAASIMNTKATQDVIDNKYLAEKYMEVVRGTRITELRTVLVDNYGFTDSSYVDDGVTASIQNPAESVTVSWSREHPGLPQNGALSYAEYTSSQSFDLGVPPYNGERDFNITVEPANPANPSGAKEITCISDGGTAFPVLTSAASENPTRLILRIPENDNERTVSVTNLSETKLEIYCVNIGLETDSEGNPILITRNNRTIPTFNILRGSVAFYDYTVPFGTDRLPEEADIAGSALTISYVVTVTVNDFVISSLKSIY